MDALSLSSPLVAPTAAEPCPHAAFSSDLEYLQEELKWVEARCRRISAQAGMERIEHNEPPRSRFDRDDASPRALLRRARQALELEVELRGVLDSRLAAHRSGLHPALALDVLCERCGLDSLERVVLLLAAAPCFARRFDDLIGSTTSGESFCSVMVESVFAFAELPLADRIDRRSMFGTRAPLVSLDLISSTMRHRSSSAKDLLTMDIEITTRTFAFITGRDELEDELLEFSSIEEPRARLDQVVLPEADKERILSVVERHDQYKEARAAWGFDDCIGYGRGTMMLFWGPPGTGKTMTAHGVASHMGKRLLNVDIPTFLGSGSADRFLPGLFREARLQDAVLFFDECEALFASRAKTGNNLMTVLLTELERFEGVAMLATNLPEHLDEALARRILVRVRFPEPDRAQRAEIWRRHLPAQAPLAADVDVERLAARFEITGGLIKNAVLMSVAAAVHGAGDAEPEITHAHLEAAAAAQLSQVDAEGRPVTVPEARLCDLVLAPPQWRAVEQLLAAVQNRRMVLQQWGVGGPRVEQTGVAALFHGPPGTGKTLCAEALAGELNRPLRVARAPALLSKWVGDTERNLEQLFRDARGQRAVILLDEADSLLGRRDSPGASRHDQSMTNVLLDLIDQYPGLVLLATNLPERLDPALARRLAWRLEFLRPEQAERQALWACMLPDSAPLADDVDLHPLAQIELSGAGIRSATLRAATQAAAEGGPVRQLLLVRAAQDVARESQA